MNSIKDKIYYKLGYTYRYGSYRKIHHATEKDSYGGREIYKGADGNNLLAQKIASGKPFLAARVGSTELSTLYTYYAQRGKNIIWEPSTLKYFGTNSGFFPSTPAYAERFCDEMFAHLHHVDVMALWYIEGEEEICNRFCTQAEYIDLLALEPYFYNSPWSCHFKGKKVLVIHPFDDSIKYQVANNREKLFANPDVLPDFELKTIKAVQSITGAPTGFKTWFDAYRHMCDQILATDFDIAVIGAGAYGLPLGSFVKSINKQAIHMGGATQLLFGVWGNRWMDRDVSKFFNEYWKRPYPHETPEKANTIENACYW